MDDLDIVSPFVSEHIKLFPLLYHQFFLRVSKLENPLDLEDNYLVLCVLSVFQKITTICSICNLLYFSKF